MATISNTRKSSPDFMDDEVESEFFHDGDSDRDDDNVQEKARRFDLQSRAAERLSMRLLEAHTEEEEMEVINTSFRLGLDDLIPRSSKQKKQQLRERAGVVDYTCSLWFLFVLAFLGLTAIGIVAFTVSGPPNQPVGAYQLVERQIGEELFKYYTFLEGRDSVGSNGYNTYVSESMGQELGILNVTLEQDHVVWRQNQQQEQDEKAKVPFVYMSSAPMPDGRRYSLRLEGKRRFNRGLFLLDVRHMPTGCGAWPAFWLTDEDNWPVHGEIDILEGVNYQSTAKTALHTTKGCRHESVPPSYKTGTWDTAVGIPDRATGIPDMTIREANDCFVYNPKQWLNQGCVAVSGSNETLGKPMNDKGGGIYALEWDPVFSKIRTWVFDHDRLPKNLVKVLNQEKMTVVEGDDGGKVVDVVPNPDEWPLPYGYYSVGTYCMPYLILYL